MNPTKTTNRLHFEDLDPKRFEDLCLSLVYRMKKWKDIKHYGASGNDDGIDIYATDQNDDEEVKWMIQCKRYKSIKKNEIKKLIDKIITSDIPDIILLIISCDVSKKNQDYFNNYSQNKGIKQNFIWAQSILEAKLYSDYNDLLYIYFNIDIRQKIKSHIKLLNKRIKMRDLFKKELYNDFDTTKPLIGFHRFNCGKIIIQKPKYSHEQENTPDEFGWYSYFSVKPYNITDEGIILVIDLIIGYIKDDILYKCNEKKDYPNNINITKFLKLALLPYDNILTYDLNSDEGRPIMFCKYSGEFGPFKNVYYDYLENYK